ncbi:MAG: DNA primase [Deltaproteobacteria bacterium]|nr:DNA primase [Deltaproteobacteria bacterium]
MRFSDEFIQEVSRHTNLVDLARNHVELRRAGDGDWWGLCPFHTEKTPSFKISSSRNSYHCFGCGAGGGPIKFMMEITGQGFVDSVKDLAARANIPVPVSDPRDEKRAASKRTLLAILADAQEYYSKYLFSSAGEPALRYLAERGISREVVKEFGVGLAPPVWDGVLNYLSREKKFAKATILEAGLVKAGKSEDHYYDVFRDRIMIPVTDGTRNVVAFGGRTFGPNPDPEAAKYINSPTTAVYDKGRLLFGLPQARPHIKSGGIAYLVEGYFDLIAMSAAGVKPVVATMGTALTQGQVNLLIGCAKEIQLVFDGDEAGARASKRAFPFMVNAELESRVIRLPDQNDPDSFVRAFGTSAFYDLSDKAQDLFDFWFQSLASQQAKTISGQGRILTEVKDVLAQIPDPAKKQFVRNQVAARLNISPELLTASTRVWNEGGEDKGDGQARAPRVAPNDLPVDYNKISAGFLSFVITHRECLRLLDKSLLSYWPEDRTKPVARAFVEQYETRRDIFPEEIRLEEDPLMSNVIYGALMGARQYMAPESLNQARNMLLKLSDAAGQKTKQEYTKAIKQAAAAGDTALVETLMRAKQG